MYFFIILILLYSEDWKNWNEWKEGIRNPQSEIRNPECLLKLFIIFANIFASLAQLVEQLIRNEQVVGSSPIGGSKDCGFWKIKSRE
jgi:hypothetical protein